MSVSSGTGSPGWSRTKGRKTVVVVVVGATSSPQAPPPTPTPHSPNTCKSSHEMAIKKPVAAVELSI